MATRSSVVVKFGENNYRGIYCHWDGYPDGVGDTLRNNFNNLEVAKEIIELGDCSAIYGCVRVKPIGEHSFEKPEKGTIIAYHRDREEKYHAPINGSTWKIVASQIDCEYAHVFEDDRWTSYRV